MLKLRQRHWHWHCSSSSSSGIGLLGRQHMSSIILLNDPIPLTPFFFFFLSKGLHLNTLPPHPNPIIHMSSRITNNRINRGGGFTFNPNPNPNACLRDDDAFHKGNGNANGNGNPMGNLRFAFPPQHLQLLIKENSTASASESDASSHRGTLLRFPHHPLPPDKIVVAVDVDEVLGNFVSALNRFIADRYSFNHSVSEYHVYEFFKIWNCSRDEADIRVHEFFKTSYFKTGIHPIPGAQRTLHKLSRFCNLAVVTSRQNAIKDHTIEWIERHYPGLFQEIHFGNHFALDGESRPKSEICRSLGAKVLIDDNPRYAIECAKVGIRVLLFDYENSYPWCKTESVNQHPLVTKVHNWEEVEQQLISWTVS